MTFLEARPNRLAKLFFIICLVIFCNRAFAVPVSSLDVPALAVAAGGTSGTDSGTRVVRLSATPTSLSFGAIPVGTSQTLVATLSNSGSTALNITQVTLSGDGFSTRGLSLPMKLNAGQSVAMNVTFVPQSANSVAGTVVVTATASSRGVKGSKGSSSLVSATVALSGAGSTRGQLTLSPGSLSFGGVQVGSFQTLPVQVSNTGGSSLTLSQANVSGAYSVQGLTLPLTLAAGQSANFSVRFAPLGAGTANGSVTLLSDAANGTASLPLTGTGLTAGALSANPSSVSFGNTKVSTSKSLQTSISNTGGTSVTVSQVATSGTGMSVSGVSLPRTLAAGQSMTADITFAPTSAGNVSGSLVISSNGSNPTLTIPLSGSGVTAGTLATSPSSLSFGAVTTGTSVSLSETLTNTGGTTVTISQATATGASYSISGLTVPRSLAPGQSVAFTVKCSPTSAGYITGSVAITSDGSNPSLTIPLSTSVVSPSALAASPTTINFGNVGVGSSSRATVNLSNSGGSSIHISQLTTVGTGLSFSGVSLPLTLAAGQSVPFTVTFVPQATGALAGTVSIVSDASNPTLNIPVAGSGVTEGTLTPNPTAMSFGSVSVGSSKTLSEVLTNSGGGSLTLSSVNATGSGYNVSGPTLPLTLASGQSATFTVSFSPNASGPSSGSLAVTTSGSSLSIPLSGSGTSQGQLAASQTSINFGNTVVGVSSSRSFTLSATGASVAVSSATSSSSEFTTSGLTLPLTIAAGTSVTFNLNFNPNAVGTATATLSFGSNASNTPVTVALSGTGTTPQPHSVTLLWSPSSATDVVSYNVYRGTVSGGPYVRTGTSLDATPTYLDETVQAGGSYYYVVTAVDGSGLESGYSNQVSAVIPTP